MIIKMSCSGYPLVIPPPAKINPTFNVLFRANFPEFNANNYLTPNPPDCPAPSGPIVPYTPPFSPYNILTYATVYAPPPAIDGQFITFYIQLSDSTVIGTVNADVTNTPTVVPLVPSTPGSLNNLTLPVGIYINISAPIAGGCLIIILNYQHS